MLKQAQADLTATSELEKLHNYISIQPAVPLCSFSITSGGFDPVKIIRHINLV